MLERSSCSGWRRIHLVNVLFLSNLASFHTKRPKLLFFLQKRSFTGSKYHYRCIDPSLLAHATLAIALDFMQVLHSLGRCNKQKDDPCCTVRFTLFLVIYGPAKTQRNTICTACCPAKVGSCFVKQGLKIELMSKQR